MCSDIVIVIPVYYNQFSYFEKISLQQTIKILSNYDMYFVIPHSLEISNDIVQPDIKIISVKDEYMSSIDNYSEMLCTEEFYELFDNYDYMLIAQIDTFIFEDRLQYFCEKKYDYIGAPWPYTVRVYDNKNVYVPDVGNGGLSLRNIKKHIEVLKKGNRRRKGMPEDVFWAIQKCETFKVAPVEVASLFSLELSAEKYYLQNNCILPMGCHAWWKVEYLFWKDKIEKRGYNLPISNKVNEKIYNYKYLFLSKEKTKEIIDEYIMDNEFVYIWGAGMYGEDMGWLLNKIGHDNYSYIDKYKKGYIFGKEIKNSSILNNRKDNSIVIIANKRSYNEIKYEIINNKYNIKSLNYIDILKKLQNISKLLQ